MAEMRVTVESSNRNELQMDSDGRVTVNSLGQISATMYTEATTSRTTSGTTAQQDWLSNASACWVGVDLTALSGR
jgi:hypothetical protein